MRRRASFLLWLLVPGLLLVPVLTAASAAPVPVRPAVVELALSGVDPAAAAEPSGRAPALRLGSGAGRRTVLLTSPRTTGRFGLLGVTWDRVPARPSVLEVWTRTRTDGTWSDWTLLGGAADEEPDAAEAAGSRSGTSPLWTGADADGVQVRVDLLSGAAPTGLRVALVDPGRSPADDDVAEGTGPADTAEATVRMPAIRTRADWGADESLRSGSPSYAASVKAVVLHHTASSNDYAPGDVPALLRGFYAYHVEGRGWADLAYNVLVDRFGTAWEGRAGGLSRAVVGAHAGGFNTGTVGVSMIGTYDAVTPSPAMLETVARVTAWKTAAAGLDPVGQVRLSSGGSTRFAAGASVVLPTVLGHREVSTTACPGLRGVAALPALRARAAALGRGAPPVATGLQLVVPTSVDAGGEAEVLVRGGTPGARVELFVGRRGEQGAVLRRTGVLSEAGTYRASFPVEDDLTVFALAGEVATARATVHRTPERVPGPAPVAARIGLTGPVTAVGGSTVRLTATGPPGTAVQVWLRPEGVERFARRAVGRFDRSGRFVATYRAARAVSWFARTSTAASAEGSTGFGPVPHELDVTVPETVPAGRAVPVAVQGRPGQPVALWFAREGETGFTRRREGVLDADGMYRTTFVATADQALFATSGSRSSTRRRSRTTTPPPAVPASPPRVRLQVPPTANAGAAVPVTVTGAPRAEVQLWTRRRGTATWTRSRSGAFGPDGRWTTAYAGVDDHELWASSRGTTSADVVSLAVPVLKTPASTRLGAPVRLLGRARPGDVVVVESRPRGVGELVRRTLRADRHGAFTATYVADDEYEHVATADSRTGALRRTAVLPTVVGSSRARRGTAVGLEGTARPGASVEVLFRPEEPVRSGLRGGTPAAPAPFAVRRVVRADARGRWQTSFVLSGRHRWYARSDGLASAVGTTTPA